MRKRTLKGAAMIALAGMVFQFGNCINWQTVLQTIGYTAVFEWVTDNNAVFDLFPDGP